MSKFNGRLVNAAYLHEGLFVQDVGNLPANLVTDGGNPTTSQAKAVKMRIDEPFLVIEMNGSKGPVSVVTPLTNVKSLRLAPEEASAPPAKK